MLPSFLRKLLAPVFSGWHRYIRSALPLHQVAALPTAYRRYFKHRRAYAQMPGGDLPRGEDIPCLFDWTDTTPFATEYFYQDIWALEKILAARPASHMDVGSRIILVGMLTVATDVTFVDIRPIEVNLPRLRMQTGSILQLPYAAGSVGSLSCLHVAEHIGLGRYGDPLDPAGSRNACRELARVLAPGGRLYFSMPIGRPRVCFNAHRIHGARQIVEYFHDLQLVEFTFVHPSEGLKKLTIEETEAIPYGVGLFIFTR